ncbi:MAG: lipooligosaccharide sialyltransferase [Lachnospiraceae bacterium]|nr:lipooligosaccharide sialyltransferase [Lachnospiraceae bacterium]
MGLGRIYVCHTFYHLYVSYLKEFALGDAQNGNATVVLSKMSNDFGDIKDRILKNGVFKEVYEFDEKRDDFFPELAKYRTDKGNVVANMANRIVFTRKFAKLEAPYVPVDFKKYDEIFVFCDSDPIGIYLNQNKIKYHALEDGLNNQGAVILARYDNRGFFGVKKFFSMYLNLIFIQDGFSKYCIDMEVNDVSVIKYPFKKYKEVPRAGLEKTLTLEQKEIFVKVFVKDLEKLEERIASTENCGANVMILTEPLCTLDVRERIFRDLKERYEKEGIVFFKIHPRDELDYKTLFPDVFQFDKTVPMEILNFFPRLQFHKVVSVFTELSGIRFAKEKEKLGRTFMDQYEDPEIHNMADKI